MHRNLGLAFKLVKIIFGLMQDLSSLREELKKVAEALKERKRQEKVLRQKLRKLKVFKRKKLPKLCVCFLANELESVSKLVQELKDLQEVIDPSTTEGKAMLSILRALRERA